MGKGVEFPFSGQRAEGAAAPSNGAICSRRTSNCETSSKLASSELPPSGKSRAAARREAVHASSTS